MATGLLNAADAWFQNPGMGYYPGQTSAGPTSMQEAGWGSMTQGGQMAQDFASGMGSSFNDMLSNPYMVDPSAGPQTEWNNIGQGPQVGSWQIQGGGPQVQGSMIGQGPQVQGSNVNAQMMGAGQQIGAAPQVGEASMNMFQNPYLTKSIQAGMGQNNRNFSENVMPGVDTGANMAGAAGGSRHGLAQGIAMGKLNQANLDMSSQMNERAYNQGMSNFLGQRSQNLGAQTTNAGNWMQGNLANQSANLQAQGMNMNDALARAQGNQSAGLQGQMANQANSLQAQGMNQNQWLQSQLANQSTGMQGQIANQANWLDLQKANQSAGQQGEYANQNQWGQNERANQQAMLAGSNANANNWLSGQQGNQNYMSNMMSQMPGMMNAYGQSMMAPGTAMANAGNQQWGIAQNQINGEMNRWNWQRDMPANRINQYGGMINMAQGGGASAMPGYTAPPGMDWGQGMAGLGNAAMNIPWNQGGGAPTGGYSNNGGGDWFNPGNTIGYQG